VVLTFCVRRSHLLTLQQPAGPVPETFLYWGKHGPVSADSPQNLASDVFRHRFCVPKNVCQIGGLMKRSTLERFDGTHEAPERVPAADPHTDKCTRTYGFLLFVSSRILGYKSITRSPRRQTFLCSDGAPYRSWIVL
jgi:hypothetical protein